MSYSLYEADVQEHECVQNLFSVCIHVLVQWLDDDLYSRSKQLLDSKHSQKNELCVIENSDIYIYIYIMVIAAHGDVYCLCLTSSGGKFS